MRLECLLLSCGAVGVVLLSAIAGTARAADKAEFARPVIDLGVVVSDIDRSVEFYTDAIGFSEAKGFSVPADFAGDAGLTANKPLEVHVLVLGEGDDATKLKLMQVKGAKSKKSDNDTIHSQLGFRYLTIFVSDTTKALARLKKAGVQPIAKGPVPLPKDFPEGMFLTVVRDPDGNLVELVGPKKTRTRKARAAADGKDDEK